MIGRCRYDSGKPAFDKITSYIQKAKDAGGEILIGGSSTCIYLALRICTHLLLVS